MLGWDGSCGRPPQHCGDAFSLLLFLLFMLWPFGLRTGTGPAPAKHCFVPFGLRTAFVPFRMLGRVRPLWPSAAAPCDLLKN